MAIKIERQKETREKHSKDFDLNDVLTREISLFGNSFNAAKKEQWYDELSVLLTSGINLKAALELLIETQKKQRHKLLFEGMLRELISGASFSETVRQKEEFTQYEYVAIKIGEQTGN